MMLNDLNPAQRRAVQTLCGPLLVLAGAGTGKTRVVTCRIVELIRNGIPPERILAVTFTNKAALEMQERVGVLLGKQLKQRPEVSTFHSLCVRILRRHIRKLGYPAKFAIYDRSDQESVARSALREIRTSSAALRPGQLLQWISRWKSFSLRPAEAVSRAQTDREHLAAAAYGRYQRALKNAGAVDFDDLLLCAEQVLQDFPDVRAAEARRFDHVLVDEYQDTNLSQYRIVKFLAERHRNLCVVGDDDQSIYGWRGADVTHILRFTDDWPNTTIVRLEQNYRSSAPILEMANRLIAFNRRRHAKRLQPARPKGSKPRIEQFQDETDEAKSIVADIRSQLALPGRQPRQFAILFRTNEQPRAFESELRRVKLPYVLIGGMSFFDRKEVRDVVAYLKVLDAPDDDAALLRILNTPPRGLGPKTVESLISRAAEAGTTVWDVLCDAQLGKELAPTTADAASGFVGLIERHRKQLGRASLVAIATSLLDEIDYRSDLQRIYADPNEHQSRWDAVQEVVNALGAYQTRSTRPALRGFLNDLSLEGREFDQEKENQLRRNAVVLMTLHSAKGLEFPDVYLVGMEEGLLPHHRSLALHGDAIEEERRLCYVGVTRAQQRLTLSLSLTRMKWGKPRASKPSRFLYELIGRADNPHTVVPKRRAPKKAQAPVRAAKRR